MGAVGGAIGAGVGIAALGIGTGIALNAMSNAERAMANPRKEIKRRLRE